MGVIFLNLLNMSITASWLILAVLVIRLLFRRIPKWITCLLWGVVAIRLIFPFSIESVFSLQPSAEPIRTSTMVEGELIPYVPSVDSNIGVVENTVKQILDLGVQVEYEMELGKNLKLEELENQFDAIFLCIGANKSGKMGVEGENLNGVFGGNELLEFNTHPNYTGKIVSVIGGGNVAMDCARTIKKLRSKTSKCHI